MPAWQLATAFIHRIHPGVISHIGGIYITVVDGKLDVIPQVYKPDPATPHTL
jgi:hypothetical protein